MYSYNKAYSADIGAYTPELLVAIRGKDKKRNIFT
jgi:hypothetical protein